LQALRHDTRPRRDNSRNDNPDDGASMTTLLFVSAVALLALAVFVGAALMQRRRRRTAPPDKPVRRRPLTPRQQQAYHRLVQCLPEHLVFAQVALSSLLTARDRATRSTFNRKVADFVVCTRSFEVLAVIAIDDGRQGGVRSFDGRRDALLEGAGYRVLRYDGVPDVMDVLRDFQSLSAPATMPRVRVAV
jgi:MYXO-CTERM domain-containing protein